jgi:hypothetical protein
VPTVAPRARSTANAPEQPAHPPPATGVDVPDLRPTRFSDFEAIERLESQFFEEMYTAEDRRRTFEDNPLWPRLHESWPLGWVLEDSDGTIVGSVGNIPSTYVYRGEEKICANGHSWVTSAQHRGYAPFLMHEYFQQDDVDLFVSSRVGPEATSVWQGSGGRPVGVGDWATMAAMVTDPRRVARAGLEMAGVPCANVLSGPAAWALRTVDRLRSRPLGPTPDDVEVVESRGFDDRFDEFWDELRTRYHDTVLAVRDRAALEWRLGVPLRAGTLWVFEARRRGRMRAYLVVKAHYHRPAAAHRTRGVHRMRIVDHQSVDGTVDLLPPLVRAAAARCAADGYALLESNACDVPKMHAFDGAAPHRTKKQGWSFYVQTSDESLVPDQGRPGAWDPSDYDGEPSYR